MAKRKRRVLQARKRQRDDDALLVRSAESLGRVIGSLQRQLQGSSKRVASVADDALKALPDVPRFDSVFGDAGASRKRTRARATRKTTRTGGARKASAARKASGSRQRSGSRRTSKKR